MDLVSWLEHHNLTNPHAIPEELKYEFDALFGDLVISWPQPGGQEEFLNCTADIVIYGGEVGGGKSWCILQEPCKWVHIPEFRAIITRRTYSQIFDADGLWWNACKQYADFGAKPKNGKVPYFQFPSGAQIFFKHSQHAMNVEMDFQGIAGAYIGVDELTHYTKEQFLYIVGRNRTSTGIEAYVRCSCNPDPDSWVRDLIKWWIGEDGFIIDERCGVIMYMINEDDEFIIEESPEKILERFPNKKRRDILTITFIRGRLSENKKMGDDYGSKLELLTAEKKKALRDGNWNHYEHKGALFSHKNFNQNRVEKHPDLKKVVIGIDPAGSTSKASDETGIVASGISIENECYVLDDHTGKYHPNDWAKESVDLFDSVDADYIVAESNYGGDMVKNTIDMYCKSIGRSDVKVKLVSASRGKVVRAQPVATLYKNGKVHHVGHTKLKKLESEIVSSFIDGKQPDRSPNRGDALVWTITELAVKTGKRVVKVGSV